MENCIFCKIIHKEIPCKLIFEDDEIIAFHDINPKAKIHFLLVPKIHIASLAHTNLSSKISKIDQQLLLGKLLLHSSIINEQLGGQKSNITPEGINIEGGFKTIINTGKDHGQEVFHLHIHVLSTPII